MNGPLAPRRGSLWHAEDSMPTFLHKPESGKKGKATCVNWKNHVNLNSDFKFSRFFF